METTVLDVSKKLTSAPIYKENPFINDMVGEMKIKHKTQLLKSKNNETELLVVSSEGEVAGHSAFMRHIEVDEDKFAKLYISQLAALWELKKTSLKVLSYILSTLKPHDDKVYFHIEDCKVYCEYAESKSVFNGLLGLINAKIIARTDRSHFYYINPAIVFNGSRVTFITSYTKKIKEKPKTPSNQTSLLDQPGVIQE